MLCLDAEKLFGFGSGMRLNWCGIARAERSSTSLASTCAPGKTRATVDRPMVRRAKVSAPTIAIKSRIEVISNGRRYFVNNPKPIDAVSPTSDKPGGLSGENGTEYRTNITSPMSTAPSTMAVGTR